MSEWTRLANELPPQNGSVFETRFDDDPCRYFMVWTAQQVLGRTHERVGAVYLSPEHPNGFTLTTMRSPDLRGQAGWWRLIPGDEPPAPISPAEL